MLVFHSALFLEDARLNFFSGRVAGASDWFSLIRAFGLFLGHTHGVGALGLIGLLFLPGGARRRIIWAAFALDLALALKLSGTDTSRLFRMGIALAPPLFLGAGFLLDTAWARAGAGGRGGAIWTARAPALVAALIIALMAFRLGDEIRRQFREIAGETGKSCVFDIEAADAAGKWLRGRLLPGDLVMATHLEWLADCRTASPMLANLAEGGEGNPIYPKALRRRFVYPCRLSDVRFAIEHEASPAMEAFFQYRSIGETIRAWPLAWSRGSIRIHRNPRLAE
ncbi:MAG: hypothetical protein BWZ10_03483 [candidate division BRC1 bacterium ADurb.BinA364]|nr:MAG: hypothetical protein BWZ10_03483 [candidate division BRC1 bacterium ADurb.BinA364]